MNTSTNPPSPSDAEHVREVVDRLFRAVEGADAAAYLDRTYHPDVVIHEAPSLPYGGDYHGLEGVLDHAEAFLAAWGPYRGPEEQAMDAVIDAVTDNAYVRWRLRASGREFLFLSHYRFTDGLITESRMYPADAADVLAWWNQLNAETPKPPAGSTAHG